MKQKFTKEAKIGLVTLIGFILLYVGVNYLKGINLFKPVNQYFVTFDNVKDLTVSSPVYVEGFKVGLVRSLSYDYSTVGKITVEISLEKDMKVNKGSYITIGKSLLGGAELNIHLNKYVSEYMKSGSEIEGRAAGDDMMASLQDKVMPAVVDLLPKIDSILMSLQEIVSHPSLSQSLTYIERTTGNLEASTRQLNRMLADDVPVIMGNFRAMSENFNSVSDQLKGLNLNATLDEVNKTLANLQTTSQKLNSKDNTFGLLLNDQTLYMNLNKATENAATLLFDLKENPKRYVHFSIF